MWVRFTLPTVENRHAYVGAKKEVDVYGHLLGRQPKMVFTESTSSTGRGLVLKFFDETPQ